MQIDPSNNMNNVSSIRRNNFVEVEPQEESKQICYGTIQAFDSSVKLHTDIEGFYDAFSTFYINKNGSGSKITAWGQRTYPIGTFSDVYKQAEEIYQNTKSRSYNKSDTEMLIKAVEDKISSLEDEK